MTDYISPTKFQDSEGTEDWRVIGDGASACFRTGSFAAGARFVAAIGELPGIEAHAPDIDLRPASVTLRIVTNNADYMGMTLRHVQLAPGISPLPRQQGLASDPPAVPSM